MLALKYCGLGRLASGISARQFTKLRAQQLARISEVVVGPPRSWRARLQRSAAFVAVADRPGHPADAARFGPVPPRLAFGMVDRSVAGRLHGAELGDQQRRPLRQRRIAVVAQLLLMRRGV